MNNTIPVSMFVHQVELPDGMIVKGHGVASFTNPFTKQEMNLCFYILYSSESDKYDAICSDKNLDIDNEFIKDIKNTLINKYKDSVSRVSDIDISSIVHKLIDAGYAQKHATGYKGLFSIKHHSHILTKEEFNKWIELLHKATPHNNNMCTDIHEWNWEELN